MNSRIRHWLGLPLLTRKERRKLNAYWWHAAAWQFPDAAKSGASLEHKIALNYIIDEFADAIDWIEEL